MNESVMSFASRAVTDFAQHTVDPLHRALPELARTIASARISPECFPAVGKDAAQKHNSRIDEILQAVERCFHSTHAVTDVSNTVRRNVEMAHDQATRAINPSNGVEFSRPATLSDVRFPTREELDQLAIRWNEHGRAHQTWQDCVSAQRAAETAGQPQLAAALGMLSENITDPENFRKPGPRLTATANCARELRTQFAGGCSALECSGKAKSLHAVTSSAPAVAILHDLDRVISLADTERPKTDVQAQGAQSAIDWTDCFLALALAAGALYYLFKRKLGTTIVLICLALAVIFTQMDENLWRVLVDTQLSRYAPFLGS